MKGEGRISLLASSLLLLSASGCGGGGGSSAPAVTAPAHATPSLSLNAANSVEIGVQTVAVLTSLRTLGYALAYDLDSVSPASPARQSPCGTGQWTLNYVDADSSGSRSAGDRIVMAAPGCAAAYFGNGSATATILQVSGNDLTDVRIAVDGGTLPYLEAWNWIPAVRGTLRMTADGPDLWLRSEGDIVLSPGGTQSFRAFNLGLRLRDDVTNNPPAPGIVGGLDIGFDTPAGAGGSVAVDTSGLFAGHAANVAPSPGPLVLRGAGRSAVRIVDARPASVGWYLIATDADGDGVEESSTTLSYLTVFDAL